MLQSGLQNGGWYEGVRNNSNGGYLAGIGNPLTSSITDLFLYSDTIKLVYSPPVVTTSLPFTGNLVFEMSSVSEQYLVYTGGVADTVPTGKPLIVTATSGATPSKYNTIHVPLQYGFIPFSIGDVIRIAAPSMDAKVPFPWFMNRTVLYTRVEGSVLVLELNEPVGTLLGSGVTVFTNAPVFHPAGTPLEMAFFIRRVSSTPLTTDKYRKYSLQLAMNGTYG